MHKSGITVSQELKAAFAAAQAADGQTGFFKMEIVEEQYELKKSGTVTGSLKEDFAAMQQLLEEAKPCCIAMKLGPQKWLLIAYTPDDSEVKAKMLYASSRAGLKEGLGAALFTDDFFFSEKQECDIEHYQVAMRDDKESLMTFEERVQKEEAVASSPDHVRVTAMASLPLKTTDSATKAFQLVKAGDTQVQLFEVDPNTQALSATSAPIKAIEDAAALMTKSEPRYILFNYPHKNPVTDAQTVATIFIYYCPEDANRNNRMIYASCKRMFVESCDKLQIPLTKKFEFSLSSEINTKAIMEEIYPPKEAPKGFSKPTRPGRGPAKFLAKK